MSNEKKSPALDRIVARVRDQGKKQVHAEEWHTDVHVDGGSSWHGDAWQG